MSPCCKSSAPTAHTLRPVVTTSTSTKPGRYVPLSPPSLPSWHAHARARQVCTNLSSIAAEYPASLANQLASLMAPFCSSLGHRRVPLSNFSNLLSEPVVHRRPPVCDGAGMNSPSPKPSPLQDVVAHWLQYSEQQGLTDRIVSHLCQAMDSHPLTEAQQLEVASIAHSCLRPQCKDPSCLQVIDGQPFRLRLLQAFAARTKDPDHNLHGLLADGVPAGILQDIPSSFQWQQRQSDLQDNDLDGVHLLHCQGNWTKAERDPTLLKQLLQKEVQSGWVVPFAGTAQEAAQHWPEGAAIGKLNIVSAEGKDPRLVLDSAVCNANPLCKVPERVSPPDALDVQRTFLQNDPRGRFAGFLWTSKQRTNVSKCIARSRGACSSRWKHSSTTTQSATLAPNSAHIGGNALAANSFASRTHCFNSTVTKPGCTSTISWPCLRKPHGNSRPSFLLSSSPPSTHPSVGRKHSSVIASHGAGGRSTWTSRHCALWRASWPSYAISSQS